MSKNQGKKFVPKIEFSANNRLQKRFFMMVFRICRFRMDDWRRSWWKASTRSWRTAKVCWIRKNDDARGTRSWWSSGNYSYLGLFTLPCDLLTPFEPRAQTFKVNVELSTHGPTKKSMMIEWLSWSLQKTSDFLRSFRNNFAAGLQVWIISPVSADSGLTDDSDLKTSSWSFFSPDDLQIISLSDSWSCSEGRISLQKPSQVCLKTFHKIWRALKTSEGSKLGYSIFLL